MEEDHYATLGIPRSANAEEIKAAYRACLLRAHPDKAGNRTKPCPAAQSPSSARKDDVAALAGAPSQRPENFAAVQAAREVLSDEKARAAYDRALEHEDPGFCGKEIGVADARTALMSSDEGSFLVCERCGDEFEVCLAEVERGVRVFPCAGCSERLRLVS